MRPPLALLVLLAASSGAGAHHSLAEFGAGVVEISGELVGVRW